MSSAAVPSRATGWAMEGARHLRVALASELGVALAAFAVLRIIAVVHHPMSFDDTPSYLHLNFIGRAERLWTVPLVWNLFPSNGLREAVQLVFGITAWSLLAATVAELITDALLRRIGTVVLLVLGLMPQVTGWDRSLLSESLSTSLLVLLIALLLRAYQRPSRRLTAGCLVVTTLWVFARQVNVVLFVSLLPFVAVFLLRRGPRHRQAWVLAALAAVAGWGLFAIAQPGSKSIWRFNSLQILEDRIAPDPSSLAFFYAHRLPRSPVILQERGAFPGARSPLFRDPVIEHWFDHDFNPTYFGYLASHPQYSLVKPFVKLPVAVSSFGVQSAPARVVLPVPVAQLLWGTEEGDIPFWAAVAAAAAILALAFRTPVRAVPVTGLVLLASALGAILIWNTTGDPPGGGIARQFLPVAITLRLGLLLTILTCADALRRGHTVRAT